MISFGVAGLVGSAFMLVTLPVLKIQHGSIFKGESPDVTAAITLRMFVQKQRI